MRIANQKLFAFVATAALASCTSNGPGPGGSSGTGSVSEPATVGRFEATGKALKYPVRVATDGATVYTTDNLNNQVLAHKDGAVVFALTGLDQPLGLAVAGDNLFVGNVGRKDVEVYSISSKKFVRSLGGVGAFQMPNAIAVDGSTVYVVDSKANVVKLFTDDGAAAGTLDAGFRFPIDIAVDAKRVVVGDQGNHRVVVFDKSGKLVRSFGSEVASGKNRNDYKAHFTSIGAVSLQGDNVLVLDSAHSYVQVLDEFGGFKGFMGNAGDCANCMRMGLDIAVDGAGHVLATDPENRRWVTLSTELR